jgi:hypothetical protein
MVQSPEKINSLADFLQYLREAPYAVFYLGWISLVTFFDVQEQQENIFKQIISILMSQLINILYFLI